MLKQVNNSLSDKSPQPPRPPYIVLDRGRVVRWAVVGIVCPALLLTMLAPPLYWLFHLKVMLSGPASFVTGPLVALLWPALLVVGLYNSACCLSTYRSVSHPQLLGLLGAIGLLANLAAPVWSVYVIIVGGGFFLFVLL